MRYHVLTGATALFILALASIVGCARLTSDASSAPKRAGGESVSVSPQTSTTASPQTGNATPADQFTLQKMVIQRGKLRLTPQLREGSVSPLLQDVLDVRWVSQRGGAGIDPMASKMMFATDIPGVVASGQPEAQDGVSFIRLYYDAYRPAQGIGDQPHKDIVLYAGHDGSENAYLAVQDVDDPAQWKLTTLPGYGPWLEKELDLHLRLENGF